jgi:hypothetical protein
MKSKFPKYTIEELNKLADMGVPITLIDSTNGINYTLDYFQLLKKNEDYADPEDESYQYKDGSFCGWVAYVNEMNEHLPLSWIGDIYVGQKIEIK